ncbi:MAG TPA: PIN domain-containing protein [Candidatus Acidoferrum sp.]|nr:PIN domain-containing protein [Candidatus Acidoferrum sp.]
MSDKFFLDTNIFAYIFDESAPDKRQQAADLVDHAVATNEGAISFQVAQEFISLAFRRFRPPLSSTEAEQFLAMTLGPLLAVQSSHVLYWEALHLSRRYSLSWYDSLIVAAALEADCRILYTEDLQHGQKFDNLRVQNPFL